MISKAECLCWLLLVMVAVVFFAGLYFELRYLRN